MDVFYITGASSGIGEAIAELLLENTNNMVIGIARSRTIQHDRYKHHFIDLSTNWFETIFKKPTFKAEKIILDEISQEKKDTLKIIKLNQIIMRLIKILLLCE